MKYVVREMQNPEVSIIVPIARMWCVEPFFERFNQMEIPNFSEVIFYVDPSDSDLFSAVSRKAERLLLPGVKVIWGKNGKYFNDSVGDCRQRIINLHEELKGEIKAGITVGIEDDTIPPLNAITRLVGHLNDPEVGFAQGIEVGRRGYRVYGAWKVTEDKIGTLPRGTGIQDVDGGGFYCFATRTKLYRSHDFTSKNSITGFLGPDFNFVYGIKMKGYRCLTDWDLPCVHLNKEDDVIKEITVDDARHIANWNKDGSGWKSKLEMI